MGPSLNSRAVRGAPGKKRLYSLFAESLASGTKLGFVIQDVNEKPKV